MADLPKELTEALESGMRIGMAARKGPSILIESTDPYMDEKVSGLATTLFKLLRTLSHIHDDDSASVTAASIIAVRAVVGFDCPKHLQAEFIQQLHALLDKPVEIEVIDD